MGIEVLRIARTRVPALRVALMTAFTPHAQIGEGQRLNPLAIGGYLQVQRTLQPLRAARQWAAVASVRFETAPGEQAQVDFGQLRLWIADVETVVHLFGLLSSASRCRDFASDAR